MKWGVKQFDACKGWFPRVAFPFCEINGKANKRSLVVSLLIFKTEGLWKKQKMVYRYSFLTTVNHERKQILFRYIFGFLNNLLWKTENKNEKDFNVELKFLCPGVNIHTRCRRNIFLFPTADSRSRKMNSERTVSVLSGFSSDGQNITRTVTRYLSRKNDMRQQGCFERPTGRRKNARQHVCSIIFPI